MVHEIAGQESPGLTIDAEIREAFPVSTSDGKWILIGNIHNDTRGRFADGHLIRTTPIEEFFTPDVFRTKNTTYRVTFHHNIRWSPALVAAFKGALNHGN